ncbi:Interleukin 17-like protein [Mizuhopecten yessoensis]|uniref:Interleukin 17-like protein n=1 Tax=Mizuhopecten yessoensis TaxID=6573 RepID=A0A210Q837_MIZYE|nr:Interleukin 17-like protein [Mizuhopecten yessoensis]
MDLTRTVMSFLFYSLLQLILPALVSGRECVDTHVPERFIRREIANDFVDRALHRSFNLIPPLRKNLAKESEIDKLFKKIKKRRGYTLFGERSCPNTTNPASVDVIARSTCPWYIYMDVDDGRLPRVMAFANCRCDKCIGQTGHVCMPVYSYPMVLRRICRIDGYHYVPVTEKHPVGCTCAAVRDITMQIVTTVVKPNS